MKAKIRLSMVAFFLFIAGGLFVGSSNPTVAQGSGCPNGCMGPGDGCFCHIWHFAYKEYADQNP